MPPHLLVLRDAARLLLLERLPDALHRHPRRTTAAVGVMLLGAAVTAFGVAPMAAQDPVIPVHPIVEAIEPAALAGQAEALDDHRFVLYRDDFTRRTDTPQSLLRRLGVADAEALAFLRADALARRLLAAGSGTEVNAEVGDDGRLQRLQALLPSGADGHYNRLTIQRGESGGLMAVSETLPLTFRQQVAAGTIRSTLAAALAEADVPASVARQIQQIFASNADAVRNLRRGDRFELVYEQGEASGREIEAGRVLAVRLAKSAGDDVSAVWFQARGSRGAYYTLDGKSLEPAFLPAPVAEARITSGFGSRADPFTHSGGGFHKGVDYGAPSGTPALAMADGRVEFAGSQNGYGNIVVLRHDATRSTAYAHLSRIRVRVGQRVERGDVIGNVGSTGRSTGPHLHFEYRENGIAQNPVVLARFTESGVPAMAMREFRRVASAQDALLGNAAQLASAR